ncbi:MAG: hypothetical protein K5985_04235 [Lachnospiraceae bacterium]|nr:hypothetical protein [Lachnospiraceae bacterium]
MEKTKKLLLALLSALVAFTMTFGEVDVCFAGNIEDPEIWTNFNIASVDNSPGHSTTPFTLDDTYLITSITDYHWNYG